MKTVLAILLVAIAPCALAVNPEYQSGTAYHRGSDQNLSDSAWNTLAVDTADFTSPFFTVSGGVFTAKVSGRFRITLQAWSAANCSSFIIGNGASGGLKVQQCRDQTAQRGGGVVAFGYYQAGTSFYLNVLTVGGDKARGQLTVEVML